MTTENVRIRTVVEVTDNITGEITYRAVEPLVDNPNAGGVITTNGLINFIERAVTDQGLKHCTL